MRAGSSIFMKILVVILPLVSVPIIVVGYLSVRAAEDRVNRLARQEQMLKLEASAKKINDVFYGFRSDLETLVSLPVLEDFYLARSFRLEAEEEFNRENIIRIFSSFMDRTPYYHQIACLDRDGRPLVSVGGRETDLHFSPAELASSPGSPNGRNMFFSQALFLTHQNKFIIQGAGSFYSGFKELAGFVIIDLDLDRIIRQVQNIKVGENGYAFLVDHKGRVVVHPRYEPYKLTTANIQDPSLLRMVESMKDGGSGWDTYVFEGQEKVAAYAPIPARNWSLAVAIPSEELRGEAQAIRTKVIQAAALALILSVTAVSVLSYHLLRPVRRLANATQSIAKGDLPSEIPVQSSDELGDLTISFNHMVKNLSRIQNELIRSEKLISLGRLSAGVAHEIRNPLNAMKAAVVYLKRKRNDDPLIVEYTGLVSEEIDRLNRFVTEFLYFAKQSPPRTAPTDLNRLVSTVENLLEEQAGANGVYFINRLEPDLPLMEIDPHQIEQVLINLFNNALEAMPEGGSITVSTVRLTSGDGSNSSCGKVRITIHDSGSGVKEEHQPNLFDPFFTTKETGTGLGLPLSLGIVESHGGTINIAGRLGGGASVRVELPIKGV